MKNDTVLITGASQGLGYEFAKIFAQNKYNLVLVARNIEKLKNIAQELKKKYNVGVKIIQKDLSLPKSPQEIYEELQKDSIEVNILINNAGFATYGEFAQTDLQQDLNEIQVNIVSLTHLTKLFVPNMIKRKKGKILNVSSVAGFFPGPFMSVYYASKAYVLSLSEALHEELKGSGITVTTLCPGPTKSGFAKRANLPALELFKNGIMDANRVAYEGYKGLMKGKSVVIPGAKNKMQVNLLRFVPRSIVAGIVKKIQGKQ